ncbi:MAG: DUF2254 domain-containing protein [Thioalkalivibrio sp.]
MSANLSLDKLRFQLQQLRKLLWVKPLIISLLSVGAAFLAKLTDDSGLGIWLPEVSPESVEALLSVMASSMMVIATLAVASMVAAYSSASSTATPRSLKLVIADDLSQNALSTFVGAFIYSIVSLTALNNQYYEDAGLFTLLVLTALVFSIVIVTFLRWVDGIARLGRIGTTIDTIERAAADALCRRRDAPALHGIPASEDIPTGEKLFSPEVGYVQHIDMAKLQDCACEWQDRIRLAVLPGTFVTPDRPLAYIRSSSGEMTDEERKQLLEAFLIDKDRTFEDDPRFALVVLTEIASRALSPAVNDPGTAIDVIGRMVRLFLLWGQPHQTDDKTSDEDETEYDRIEVPLLSVDDMFDDAFTPIARDGAATVEVAIRLQKGFRALASVDDEPVRKAALKYARLALQRAEQGLGTAEDIAAVRMAAPVEDQGMTHP